MHDDIRDEIARLEDRIEALAEKIERCRKIMLVARVAIAAATGLIVAMAIGLAPFDPLPILAALIGVIGGIVVLGSNSGTLNEAQAALNAAEGERSALIGRIDLRLVGSEPA